MELYINILIYIFLFTFFSLSIFGYGYQFKKILINDKEESIGEYGLFGFIILYLFSVIIHFFLNLNLYLTLTILILGFILSIISLKNSINSLPKKILIPLILLFLILGASNNPHDDVYLYHLPYISYIQNEKLVFGLVNVNEFTAYSNSFYDIMSLFKFPLINNQSIYLIPTIFFMFFCIFLTEKLNQNSKVLNLFIYSILILSLLKFTRSKKFGTDIPVIALIFLIQFYVLKFLKIKIII